MAQHVYFDLDGTLTDPFEGISACILHAVAELDCQPPTQETLRHCIGPPLTETLPAIVGHELTPRAIELYRERFNEIGWLENAPYVGIDQALANLVAADYRLYVATSKPLVSARRIVDHFALATYFDAVFGSELDGTRSNKADLLRYAVAENPDANKRLMIGDRKHDVVGALLNGMTPVGVSYGFGSADELVDAVAIADAPCELPEIIGRTMAMLD